MKTLVPGHRYALDSVEGSEPQVLQFIQKRQRSVVLSPRQIVTIVDRCVAFLQDFPSGRVIVVSSDLRAHEAFVGDFRRCVIEHKAASVYVPRGASDEDVEQTMSVSLAGRVSDSTLFLVADHGVRAPVVDAIRRTMTGPGQGLELPEGYGTLETVSDGTTNEEVLRVLIDRLNRLQDKNPCRDNACAITKLDEALMWLEKRTRDRETRGVEGTDEP